MTQPTFQTEVIAR